MHTTFAILGFFFRILSFCTFILMSKSMRWCQLKWVAPVKFKIWVVIFTPVYCHLINTRHLLDTVPWVGYFPHTAHLEAPLGDYKLLLYRRLLYSRDFYLFFSFSYCIDRGSVQFTPLHLLWQHSHVTFLPGLIWGSDSTLLDFYCVLFHSENKSCQH